MNDYVLEKLLQERRGEMLAEANRQRLVKMYESQHAKRRVRLLVLLGKHLVSFGEQLICRYGGCAELSSHDGGQRHYTQ